MKQGNPNTLIEQDLLDSENYNLIYNELMNQAQSEDTHDLNDGIFALLSAPTDEDGSNKLVEVEYMGKIGYVDISFENITTDLSEDEFISVIDAVETMAYDSDISAVRSASRLIEGLGENAINIMFRECRKFDLNLEAKKNEIVHLLSRITLRSLKGRRIIKAILENASSQQHIRLAIMIAGVLHDPEYVDLIVKHAKNSEYYMVGCESIFMIRSKNSIKELVSIIMNFDTSRKDLSDFTHRIAPRFSDFGQDAIEDVFQAYLNCSPAVRSVFLIALRSFKADAIPKMEAVLNEETNEDKLIRICKVLGELRHPIATKILMDQFIKSEDKKLFIMDGMSHTKDKSLIPIVMKDLETTSDIVLKQKCLSTLAYIGDSTIIPHIKRFEQDPQTGLEASFALVRLGDDEASFEVIYERLVNGSREDQKATSRYLSLLPYKALTKLASRIINLPDDKALILVNSLRRLNLLPREAAPFLQEKLNQNIGVDLKIGIYRLIGKHVNSKQELLSQQVLYNARREEKDTRIIHEINSIISSMKQEKGLVSTIRS